MIAASSSASALDTIQVNVSLELLTDAFSGEQEEIMGRLLNKGKALATSILAHQKANRERATNPDYVVRPIDE